MITPIVALSHFVWMLSFALFLKLQFYENKLVRRGSSSKLCNHSIHQGHAIYFSKNSTIVSFDYNPIRLNICSFPAKRIQMTENILRKDVEVCSFLI